jgi:hypothetical protein
LLNSAFFRSTHITIGKRSPQLQKGEKSINAISV